ncbi:nuclear receptor coactivator 2-like [Trichoplusia ni]|uniref:Nuclear receptor coactivator 2-like n=1 Tax=Trichoplusia ni TaxID=7111 RepID=A0A7E5X1U2_TRINI|nr:nuclear receptor coactivator 2-like [Trichoplusia ni]
MDKRSERNKCITEKKRRELENETINQLEELLGTCLAEVKQPDKNGIVREATRQIQEVLRRRRECPEECPLRVAQCLSPVQAGEVSSTQPSCAGLQYSELTSLIEALKHYTGTLGWVLLEINSKAEIECITENIKELTLQDRTELYKKSIFSLLHVKDHAKLRPLLRNIQTFNWGAGEIDKFQAIQARLLIKNSNGTDSVGYAECVIHAAPVRGSSSEEAGSVMCVIRRCEDASAALLPGDGGPPAITAKQSDHIVFRLDCNFIILFCDLSGVENLINTAIPLVGSRYLDLVENSDRVRVTAHLQEAVCLPAPPAISEPFRLRITPDSPSFRVIARSRLFRAKPSSGEPDFIMSTHTVLGDEDMDLLEADGPRPPVGGPLMASVGNGESSNCEPRYRSPISPNEGQFLNDFDLEPWSLLGDMSSEESKDRKDSVEGPSQPLTPRATPTPGEGPPSNQPAEEPNRLRTLLSKKQTGNDSGVNSNNRILKDLLKQEDEEATGSETSAPHTPHTPHTPLTPHTPHTPSAALSPLHTAQAHARPPPHPPHAPHAPHQPHQPHAQHQQHPQHPQHQPHQQHQPHGSHMPNATHSMQQGQHHNNSDVLLRILNEKTDEDAEENRRNSADGTRGVSQPSALLSQLLSSSNGPAGNGRPHDSSENYLERMAAVKRKFDDAKGMSSSSKRATPENQQVTSSALPAASSTASSTATSPATSSSLGQSLLCQKNQILVSLLARQQTTPTTPLPLPNPNLRAYGPTARPRPPQPPQLPQQPQQPPQRHHVSTLSNILTGTNHRTSMNGGGNGGGGAGGAECPVSMAGSSHLQMVLQSGELAGGALAGGARAYPAPAPAALHYGTTAPHLAYNNQPPSGSTRAQSGGGGGGDSEVPSDQTLSDLLDEVIENMPDADRSAADVNVRQRQGMKEKNAMINAIRQSLMQCETVGKAAGGSSPGGGAGAAGAAGGAGGAYAGSPARAASPEPRERWRALQAGAALYADPARARALVEQQRARLLELQRTQQMLVSPEATEQPQADLGSTINALVSATPPNVTLTRTDYQHQIYHQNSQMGPHYGTNKITTSQQNPMLSRQLSVAGSGGYSRGGGAGGHSAAALHTPMTPAPPPSTPQPYHRPPHQPHAPHAPHAPHQPHAPHAPHAPLAPRPHLGNATMS